MGMVARLEQVTPQQLAEFLRQPKKAYDFAFAEFLDNPASPTFLNLLAERVKSLPPGFREQAERVTQQAFSKIQERKGLHLVTEGDAPAAPPAERKQFSLEKDWHVLHYVLNGTAEGGEGPLADSILGGKEIPDVEGVMSYGPIRYLTPDRVAAVADALASVNPAELASKLDREDAESKQIYLAHTLPDGWEYLPDLFRSFSAFYEDAARNGNAMLLDIS
jgi:hypothetical protein